jgi:hypothetical protein
LAHCFAVAASGKTTTIMPIRALFPEAGGTRLSPNVRE